MSERRIMRMPEVEKVVGYKRASIYNFVNEGSFPKPRSLGPRAVGWDSLEIQDWVNSKLGNSKLQGKKR